MGGGRSANRRVVGLPEAIEAFDVRKRYRTSRGVFSPLLSESIGQSTSQPISAFRFPLCLGRFAGAFGKVAAMLSSTALRGIMCVDRAKATTLSRRKPGNGGGNVLMRRGSVGAPVRMSFAHA